MSADAQHHARVQRLFARACELSGAERSNYLDGACGGDEALRDEVARLLALDSDSLDPVTIVEPRASETAQDSMRELLGRVAAHTPDASRYRVEGELARGGMGAILRVWDTDLNRQLAMKVALGAASASGGERPVGGDPNALARFVEEAQVTGQLDHPGIVPVHELGLDAEGRVYFTMKLVKGQTLKEVFDELGQGQGGWTQTRVLGLVLKICEAMAYAHSKGVIHRDLKPANIMVGRFGEVYVMDWGLARVTTGRDQHDLRLDLERAGVERQALTSVVSTELKHVRESSPEEALITMDGTIVGTPCYMPPEQALGESAGLGPRTDVYALGAMLYHMLSGTLPYVPRGKRLSPHTVLMALIHGPPPALATVAPEAPEDLVAICEKAMAHDAAGRYESAVELAADIQAYLEHRPVSARRHSLREVARLAYERNRPIVLTAATGALLLALALALFVWRLQDQVTETLAAYDKLETATAERERNAALLAVRALLAESDELAITPAGLGPMRTWIDRVQGLLALEGELRAESERLKGDSPLGAELRQALGQLDALRELLPRVESWERTAASLEPRIQAEDAAAWAQARKAIASSPLYGSLDLPPQVGLVPLRENPLSGLWEFWHVASGERPEVDAGMDDRYRMTPASGIVLALLPGGTFLMGDDSGQLNYVQTQQVSVAPVFLGKYEVTQGQWLRIAGRNPAQYAAGMTLPEWLRVDAGAEPFTGAHPVELVDWGSAARFCGRLGLALPHEREWEYACRTGSTGFWCWGNDSASLRDRENVRDLEAQKVFGDVSLAVPWNDGYAIHAPVGTYEGNEFGLFDMHGNVAEWCANRQEGFWLAEAHERHFYRGGSWYSPAFPYSVAAFRFDKDAEEVFDHVGLRAARSLDP